jgi:predicted ABC-type ATPase
LNKPNLYIIAGCNGAGKTTASLTLLPEILNCAEFVNADAIAAGLSPFQPEKVAIEAGKLMLKRIALLINEKVDFAIETTLSSKNHFQTIEKAKREGFEVTLLFFYLNSIELAKERVKVRVSKGGHNISENVIERRYLRGLENFEKYSQLVNRWFLYDNSLKKPVLIAGSNFEKDNIIYNENIWKKFEK